MYTYITYTYNEYICLHTHFMYTYIGISLFVRFQGVLLKSWGLALKLDKPGTIECRMVTTPSCVCWFMGFHLNKTICVSRTTVFIGMNCIPILCSWFCSYPLIVSHSYGKWTIYVDLVRWFTYLRNRDVPWQRVKLPEGVIMSPIASHDLPLIARFLICNFTMDVPMYQSKPRCCCQF